MTATDVVVENAQSPFAVHYGSTIYATYNTHIRGLLDNTAFTYTFLLNSMVNNAGGRYLGETIAGTSTTIDDEGTINWQTMSKDNTSYDFS